VTAPVTDVGLTVAVLSYDGRRLLEGILPSLAAQSLTGFRTVVVDNGSRDGSVGWLAEHWADIEVVALPENVGVTPALNVCLDAATGSELVVLLNNDLELSEHALTELVAAMEEYPEAGSAAAKLLDFNDRCVLDGAGDLLSWAGTGMRRGHGEVDHGQYDRPEAVFGACGGAAVYRMAAVEEVGGFDESFFAFFEDVDWALRAQLAGWSCRYVPNAVIFHMGSATIGRGMSEFTQYHLWRNAIWIVAKDFPLAAILRHARRIVYVQAAQLVVAARAGRLALWARAIGHALRELPRVLRARRGVQATRRVGMGELEAAVAAGQRPRRSSASKRPTTRGPAGALESALRRASRWRPPRR